MLVNKALPSLILITLTVLIMISPVIVAQEQIYLWGEAVVPALAVAQLPNGTTIGIVGEIRVKVLYPGEGKVYVSTEPLSDIDMQASVRAAVMIASYYARVNPLDYDFLVSIVTDSPLVGGPSAGSAITAAVYSALTHKQLNTNVASTGMILPDGLIGPVGGIPYKVQAAISKGYTTVLIPVGQSIYSETTYQTQTIGSVVVTRPVTITWNITDLAIKLGGGVIEVSTAVDVIREFTSFNPLRQVYGTPSLSEDELELTSKEYSYFLDMSAQIRSDVQSKLQNVTSRTIRNTIQNWLQSSNEFYSKATYMWENNYYYTGLSFAFVSAYQAMMAKYLLEASVSSSPASYLNNIYNDLSTILNNYKTRYNELVNKTDSFTLDNLFLLAEIHSRIRDAEDSLEVAQQALQNNDITSASANLGYVWGRVRSLDYWLGLLNITYSKLVPDVQVERLSSWILSYSYSSATYVDAIQSSMGTSTFDTTSWYRMLSLASSLLAMGDYPGALDLAMDVLVSSSIALQSLFSLNISRTINILSEHSKLVLGNSEAPPISARMYLMMAESFALQGNYESSLSYYERALVILYASTMTTSKQEITITSTPPFQNNITNQPSTEISQSTTTQTQTSEETIGDTEPQQTTTITEPSNTNNMYRYAAVVILAIIALILIINSIRKTEY